eukprot:g6750.t1
MRLLKLLVCVAAVAQGQPNEARSACNNKAAGAACSFVAGGGPAQGQTITGTCENGSCASSGGTPSTDSTNTGRPSTNGGGCPTGNHAYAGSAEYVGAGLAAAPLRNIVGCVDAGPLATRPTAIVGSQGEQDANNIYGPFEAGFTKSVPGMSCLGDASVPPGIDTFVAERVADNICTDVTVHILDTCGGHAIPYHYHEKLSCLYTADPATGHSTRIGTALDGHGIYGKHIAGGALPTDLDACGGRVGVTPDSGGAEVYYYPVTDHAPFTVGCFGNKASYPVSVAQCKALYNSCASAPTTITTAHGSGQYILDCPCFDTDHSNVENQGAPGYLGITPLADADSTTARPQQETTSASPRPGATSSAPAVEGGSPLLDTSTFQYRLFANSMSVSAVIISGDSALDVTGGTLIAMVGSEIRGVLSSTQTIPFGPYQGMKLFGIMVYANNKGETISFQYQTATSVFTIAETLAFVPDGILTDNSEANKANPDAGAEDDAGAEADASAGAYLV